MKWIWRVYNRRTREKICMHYSRVWVVCELQIMLQALEIVVESSIYNRGMKWREKIKCQYLPSTCTYVTQARMFIPKGQTRGTFSLLFRFPRLVIKFLARLYCDCSIDWKLQSHFSSNNPSLVTKSVIVKSPIWPGDLNESKSQKRWTKNSKVKHEMKYM